MRVKNVKEIGLEELKKQMEEKLSQYKYDINENALTVAKSEKVKLNIVKMESEYWVTPAVPFVFKGTVTLISISLLAYKIQDFGWHWAVNVGVYMAAFVLLGYAVNWFYAALYAKDFKPFKAETTTALKSIVGEEEH